MDDINIVWKNFCQGDRSAFDQLYAHYYRRLLAYCLGKLHDLPTAENLVADIFIKLLEQKDPHKLEAPENWLFSVARNACLGYWSKHNRRAEILEGIAINFEKITQSDIQQFMDVAVLEDIIRQSLNETDVGIWELHRQGFGNADISEKLGLNEKTVANRKAMIKTRLKALVNKYLMDNGN